LLSSAECFLSSRSASKPKIDRFATGAGSTADKNPAAREFGWRRVSIDVSWGMSTTCRRISVGCILVAFQLLAMAETTKAEASGVEGTVMISPARPGPTRIDEPDAAPAPNVDFVVKRGEDKVATFKTDEAGKFKVTLPPGHYVIMREDPGARIGRWRFEVDVVAGEVAKVNWKADSGMR
jgi:hypothetical protein